jgi:hypothetical protein
VTDQHKDDTVVNVFAEGIEAAETIADPLDGLVRRSAINPGAPFDPKALADIVALKKKDRAGYEELRSRLKEAGCRVGELDKAVAKEAGELGGGPTKQADILINLAEAADLFHAPDGTAYADIDVNGHRETCLVRGTGFRQWLAQRFFETTGGGANSEAVQSALNVIQAKARFDGPEHAVHIRVGGLDGRLYLDLADEAWRAIEIDSSGWRVVEKPPVRFRRASGMQPLPVPVRGGSVNLLRAFLNVETDADFVLAVAWALAVLRDRGPYPVLVVSGEQGSAKSTFSAILRALLDPSTAPLRALPRNEHELFISANNGHVLAFDNVSALPARISDALCRLATGGGFAVRQLYTDQDEILFNAARPVILNGIEDIVSRPDLADRAVFLTLEPIPEERRRSEKALWSDFEAERPRILGVLLDALAKGLKWLPKTRLPTLPRMADFALWATACEAALWGEGTFWAAYCENRDEAVEDVIEADPIAAAVRTLMTTVTVWKGTASALLDALGEIPNNRGARPKTWPDSPRAMSGHLRRVVTFLRKVGIEVEFDSREGRERNRVIRITATNFAERPDYAGAPPSALFAPVPESDDEYGMVAWDQTVSDDAADAGHAGSASTVSATRSKAADNADGADANLLPYSVGEKNGWSARL